MIACPNCGKDNELGRIFCLKCGAKLDLNAISAPTSAKNPSLRKAKKAAKAVAVNTIFTTIKVLLVAFSTAVITLIFIPPNMTRFKCTSEDADTFEEKKFQLEDAVNSNNSLAVSISEREINGMLRRHVKALNEAFKSEIKLGSIYASCENDNIAFSIDRQWRYFHVFLVYTTKPELKNGKVIFRPVSGAIGRFPLPQPAVVPYANLLTPLWAKFKFDKQTLDQMSSIKIETNFVTIAYQKATVTPGETPVASPPASTGSSPAPTATPPASAPTPAPAATPSTPSGFTPPTPTSPPSTTPPASGGFAPAPAPAPK